MTRYVPTTLNVPIIKVCTNQQCIQVFTYVCLHTCLHTYASTHARMKIRQSHTGVLNLDQSTHLRVHALQISSWMHEHTHTNACTHSHTYKIERICNILKSAELYAHT